MTNPEHLIIAGCSFSAGDSNIDKARENPSTWAHWLLDPLSPKFLYNLAIPGGGNFAISHNLVYILESKKYMTPKNTMIGFNLSSLDRSDVICPVDHPQANQSFSWSKDFGYAWLTQGSFAYQTPPFKRMLQLHMGLENLITLNCLAIVQCMTYLEHRGFDYFFMLMDDTIIQDSPAWFTDSVLHGRKHKMVTFGEHQSMHEFCAGNDKLLSPDGFHPSNLGYQRIGERVNEFLSTSLYGSNGDGK